MYELNIGLVLNTALYEGKPVEQKVDLSRVPELVAHIWEEFQPHIPQTGTVAYESLHPWA